jgi:hypothetical protein
MLARGKKVVVMLAAAAPMIASLGLARAASVITDGNSTVTFNPVDATAPYIVQWNISGTDQLGAGDKLTVSNGSGMAPIQTLSESSQNFSNGVGSANYSETINGDQFQINVLNILTGGSAGSVSSGMTETIKVSNLGPAPLNEVQFASIVDSPVDFKVAETFDADLAGTPNDDTLTLSPSGAPDTAEQTDPTGVKFTYASTPTPTQFASITNGSSSSNLGPATGNESFMFGWDLSLAPGDTGFISITESFNGTPVASVPAPAASSAAALLAGLGTIAIVRRVRKVHA